MNVCTRPWIHRSNRRPSGGVDEVGVSIAADGHPTTILGKCNGGVTSRISCRLDLLPDCTCCDIDEHDGASSTGSSTPASRGFVNHCNRGTVWEESDIRKGSRRTRMCDVFVDNGHVACVKDCCGIVAQCCCNVGIVRAPINTRDVGIVSSNELST